MLYTHHQSNQRRSPEVSVASTTPELLDFLLTRWGGKVTVKRGDPRHRPSWSWQIRFDAALAFLADVLPYMREPRKVARATMLIERHKDCTPRNGRYTAAQDLAKRALEADFAAA